MFACFQGQKFNILCNGKDDEMTMFFLAYEDKRPGHTIQFLISPVRTVCQNTLIAAMGQARFGIKISHYKGVEEMTKWSVSAFNKVASRQTAIQQAMQQLADKKIDTAGVNTVIEAAYPIPAKPMILRLAEQEQMSTSEFVSKKLLSTQANFEANIKRITELRELTWEAYAGEVDAQGATGTAWGAVNAVTAVCDHSKQGIKVARAALFGDRLQFKANAFEAAMAL